MNFESILETGAKELGVKLPQGAIEKMAQYFRLFDEKNSEMNLTAIKGEEEIARLHFLDSLAILNYTDFVNKSVIDIGTGGGFPGVPIMIAVPSASVTLLDSTEKKIDFISGACEKLGLKTICTHARAENTGQSEYRETFDVAVSRAVARLNILCELCLPMIKVGGTFIAMKAADSDEEINEAEKALETLGGHKAEIKEYIIPGTNITRRAVIIEKTFETPKKYPRRYAQMKKAPL